MNNNSFIQRGGWWVAAQNALTISVLMLCPLFRGHWQHPTTRVSGVALFVTGALFGIAGVRTLGRNRTAYPKPLEDSTLVQYGVYGRVRHPLYSSLILASLGWALFWGSWPGLAASGALVAVLRGKAIREEIWLRERYPEYRIYERRVKRLVPWVW